MPLLNCRHQCSACAYKPGSAANKELNNKINGAICAVGGIAFYCHDSLGWDESRNQVDAKADQDLSILLARNSLIRAGADPDVIANQTENTRQNLRVCEGWKAAVAQLKALGWFSNLEVVTYRRYMAKRAIQAVNDFIDPLAPPDDRAEYQKEFRQLVNFFVQEAKEADVSIAFVFGGRDGI